jgi:hypothetical protein
VDAVSQWQVQACVQGNLHRPCLLATEVTSPKGKIVKHYLAQDVKAPLACLAQLAQNDLVRFKVKAGFTLAELLAKAQAQTDLAAAQAMQKDKAQLFVMFNKPKVKLRA